MRGAWPRDGDGRLQKAPFQALYLKPNYLFKKIHFVGRNMAMQCLFDQDTCVQDTQMVPVELVWSVKNIFIW